MSVASPTPRENSSVSSNDGRLDPAVAGAAEGLRPRRRRVRRGAADSAGRTSKVPRGALKLLGHLRGRHYRASSARNGFEARSAPSVVIPMWPG